MTDLNDDSVEDPAVVAIDYHLTELRRLTENAGGGATRESLFDRTRNRVATDRHEIDDHVIGALVALAERVERLAGWQRTDHESACESADGLVEVREQLVAADVRIRRLDAEDVRHGGAIAELVARNEELERQLRTLRSLGDLLLRPPASETSGVVPPPVDAAAVESWRARSLDDLYEDLEARFRGDRAHVKRLVEVYVAEVVEVGGPVVDIGCGRGEWLELLAEHDVEAYGVDLNDTFAQANRDRGLDVRTGDALAHLATLDPGSVGSVTGFHLAEHLPFEVLTELADQTLRALRPGGLLILESPNPTNVRVGAAQFWLDPTHERPLHPELLQFLLLQRGFSTADIRMQHLPRYAESDWAAALGITPNEEGHGILDEIRDALCSAMDFAVVARR